jgi:hypothetical protein
MDWGRLALALALAALINLQLVAAGLWPPLEMRVKMAELAPQTLNPEIYEIFSEDQVRWMLSVWNSPSKYVIVDKQGRAWTVGQGEMPEPLRAALYNKSLDKWIINARAQTTHTWKFEFTALSTNGYSMTTTLTGWPHNPDVNVYYRYGWGWAGWSSNGVDFTVENNTFPYYVITKHTDYYNWETHYTVIINPSGYIAAYEQYVEVDITLQIDVYIAELYPERYHPNVVGIKICPEFSEPLIDGTGSASAGITGTPTNIENYTPPYIEVVDGGVDANGCMYIHVDMTWTEPYNSDWHHYNARYVKLHILSEFKAKYGVPDKSNLEYKYRWGESEPPPPPPPGELPKDTASNTVCSIESLSGSSLPIIQSGQIGGNGGTQVDWIIAKNPFSPKWVDNVTDLDYYRRAAVGWSWSTVEPKDCSFSWLSEYGSELDLVDASFVFDWSGWPAFRHSEVLPDQSGQYVFIWMVRLDYNSTRYIYIAYANVSIGTIGEGNRLVRAIKNAFGSALSAMISLAKKIMPDELEHLGGYAWQYFKQVKDLFAQLFNYLPWLGNVVQLLIFLMPTVIVAILVYDPFRVVEFFRWVFRMILEVVQFIRGLLPI